MTHNRILHDEFLGAARALEHPNLMVLETTFVLDLGIMGMIESGQCPKDLVGDVLIVIHITSFLPLWNHRRQPHRLHTKKYV